jgi:hypothetical protein
MRVICIKNFDQFCKQGEIFPILWNIYTVRDTLAWKNSRGYRLFEIRNEPRTYLNEDGGFVVGECAFDVIGFRELKETDISVFTELLKTKETEDA